uniref:Uncharacterized protein n=1 Tax=Anguilla anguilla TaxID=7936 RepID=A0A0E9QTH1_ANGAN
MYEKRSHPGTHRYLSQELSSVQRVSYPIRKSWMGEMYSWWACSINGNSVG